MQMKMNKRADIPVTILVIGVVGICILTILSFVGSNKDNEANFLGIGLIETMLSIEEELKLYSNEKLKFEGIYENIKLIELENIKITTDGDKVLKGNYSVTERSFPNIFTTKEKVLVRVETQKCNNFFRKFIRTRDYKCHPCLQE